MTGASARPRWLAALVVVAAPALASRQVVAPPPTAAGHVVLVGIDGLSPDGIVHEG